jgi:hypothetical protein
MLSAIARGPVPVRHSSAVSVGVLVAALLIGCAKTPSRSQPSPAASLPSSQPVAPDARKPECLQCVIEDMRQATHRDQLTVTGQFEGYSGRWLQSRRTRTRCTLEEEVVGIARFALRGEKAWPSQEPVSIEVELPCPELSRSDYAKLYHYRPDDSERDGLGHAPMLRPGQRYRLTFVRNTQMPMKDPSRLPNGRVLPTLVAVNPL